MTSWFVRPDTTTLQLSEGHWVLVKKRLNAGEQRAAFSRMYLAGTNGTLKANPLETGIATITAYLLDWSLTDDDGKPVVIRGVSVEDLTSVLNNLSIERFGEILEAVEAHEEGMAKARADAKKKTAGETASAQISPSPSDVDGPSIKSEILM